MKGKCIGQPYCRRGEPHPTMVRKESIKGYYSQCIMAATINLFPSPTTALTTKQSICEEGLMSDNCCVAFSFATSAAQSFVNNNIIVNICYSHLLMTMLLIVTVLHWSLFTDACIHAELLFMYGDWFRGLTFRCSLS